jgi:hypothetical protein
MPDRPPVDHPALQADALCCQLIERRARDGDREPHRPQGSAWGRRLDGHPEAGIGGKPAAALHKCEFRLLRAQKREELLLGGLLGQHPLEAQNVHQLRCPLGLADDHLAGGGCRLQQRERLERLRTERGNRQQQCQRHPTP